MIYRHQRLNIVIYKIQIYKYKEKGTKVIKD